jgi:ATP-dependent DNA ligase
VRPRPLRERKALLGGLLSFGGPLRFTEHRDTDGEAYCQDACWRGWEGIIAKRAESPYRPGRTRKNWPRSRAFATSASTLLEGRPRTRTG